MEKNVIACKLFLASYEYTYYVFNLRHIIFRDFFRLNSSTINIEDIVSQPYVLVVNVMVDFLLALCIFFVHFIHHILYIFNYDNSQFRILTFKSVFTNLIT